MIVLLALEGIASTISEFECAGQIESCVHQRRIEVRPTAVLLVIFAVEIPAQVGVHGELGGHLDVVGGVSGETLAASIGVVGRADFHLVGLSEQEAGETESGVAAVGAGRLRGIEGDLRDAVVPVTVELLGTELGAELEGVAATHPRKVIVQDERVRGIEVVVLAAQLGLVDEVGAAGRSAVLIAIDALEFNDGEVPCSPISKTQGARPISFLRNRRAGIVEAVEAKRHDVQHPRINGPGVVKPHRWGVDMVVEGVGEWTSIFGARGPDAALIR